MTSRPVDPPPLLNIANVLTGIRLLLVPVFLYALLAEDGHDTGWRLAAFGVFAVASFTDRTYSQLCVVPAQAVAAILRS